MITLKKLKFYFLDVVKSYQVHHSNITSKQLVLIQNHRKNEFKKKSTTEIKFKKKPHSSTVYSKIIKNT